MASLSLNLGFSYATPQYSDPETSLSEEDNSECSDQNNDCESPLEEEHKYPSCEQLEELFKAAMREPKLKSLFFDTLRKGLEAMYNDERDDLIKEVINLINTLQAQWLTYKTVK